MASQSGSSPNLDKVLYTGAGAPVNQPPFGVDTAVDSAGKRYDWDGTSWVQQIDNVGDKYNTSSTTCNTIVSNGNLTFVVHTGLSYIPEQDIIIYANSGNHMHGKVVSYDQFTGALVAEISQKTGSGNFCFWSINLDAIAATPETVSFGLVAPTVPGRVGDHFVVTSTGLSTGVVKEDWIFTTNGWVKLNTVTPVFEPTELVYVNSTSPNSATIFDLNNPPVTNDNSLKNDVNNMYIGTDGSTWTSNGTVYSTFVTPPSTEFNISGTTTDAGSNKTSRVWRSGAVKLGGVVGSVGVRTLDLDAPAGTPPLRFTNLLSTSANLTGITGLPKLLIVSSTGDVSVTDNPLVKNIVPTSGYPVVAANTGNYTPNSGLNTTVGGVSTMPFDTNVYITSDGDYVSPLSLPAPAGRVGELYFLCRSTFPVVIKNTNTNMPADVSVSLGKALMFRSDGNMWYYEPYLPPPRFSSDFVAASNVVVSTTTEATAANVISFNIPCAGRWRISTQVRVQLGSLSQTVTSFLFDNAAGVAAKIPNSELLITGVGATGSTIQGTGSSFTTITTTGFKPIILKAYRTGGAIATVNSNASGRTLVNLTRD